MQARYYSPSGKFGVSSLLLGPMLGAGTGLVLAIAYAYINVWNPFIYVTFLATLGLAFGSAIVMAVGLQKGKARNRVVGAGIGLFVGLVTLYFSWAFYAFALLQRSDVEDVTLLGTLFDPIGIGGFILGINENAVWSIKGAEPPSWALWGIWAIEAIIIVGASAFTGWTTAASPFCEKCQTWSEEKKDVFRIAKPDPAELKQRLEALDISLITGSPKPGEQDAEWCRFDTTQCPCKETTTISAVLVKVTPKKDKEPDVSEDTVVDQLLMPADYLASASAQSGK